ncbi:MAG TPA: choice-of-anchor tandem repeat GloVer-containing protein, partial [Bacteroidia bacterium]|nr:choice-of-anchor tandem repeat GloVer-containing protein [Bacteroidia bacterium]
NGGGQNGAGTIFSTDSTGYNETVQYSFSQSDGMKPLFTNLIQATDGTLYGMTYQGGVNNFGVLFQYNPLTLTYTKKFDFDSINGSKPLGSLMQANDGMLYGMAYKGGLNDKGVLFQFNPITSVYIKKFDFGALNGCYPHGSLIQANDGMLYSMTVQGGANDFGVLFQYNPITNSYTKKFDFDSIHGSNPLGSLVQARDSMLYGFTTQGGTNDMGVLFQYNPKNFVYTKKMDFTGVTNGNFPLGFLIATKDTNLYGMTNRGGVNDMGVIFQYNPYTSTYTKKFDFDSIQGSYPSGSLMQASDEDIYGMTNLGGVNNMGVLFQYNPNTSTYSKKLDYNMTNGEFPFGSLIEINTNQTGLSNYSKPTNQILVFPNPNKGIFTIQSKNEGVYSILNALGQEVQSFELNATNDYSIHIENMDNGIYTLIGFNSKYIRKQKIVIVK